MKTDHSTEAYFFIYSNRYDGKQKQQLYEITNSKT